jgi:hypothetical protein
MVKKKIDMEVLDLSDPFMSLNEWKSLIENLIKKYGSDAILYSETDIICACICKEQKGAQNG